MRDEDLQWNVCSDPHCPNASWPGPGHQHPSPLVALGAQQIDPRGTE